MILKIKNFGKIAEANMELDGITVICGDNNTGKSTVGKALFSFFNSLNDYRNKIYTEKYNKFKNVIRSYATTPRELTSLFLYPEVSMEYIANHNDQFTTVEVRDYIEDNYGVKISKENLTSLVNYLNTPEIDILSEYVFRYIANVMNGQIRNSYSSNHSSSYIEGVFKDFTNKITVRKESCVCDLDVPIEHSAVYINNPFSLDGLNDHVISTRGGNPMSRSAVEAILQAQTMMNANSMANILDSVLNKKDLETVRKVIRHAYSGDTVIDRGRYYYSENGVKIDFRNISAGLKSFAIIERLLETGVLKRKDVLILDEPEIHLHSEWQKIYAELIVVLQKTYDLTVLMVTHSSQFLESLIYYSEKYGIEECVNYYSPIVGEKGVSFRDYSSDLTSIRTGIKKGLYSLADEKLSDLADGDGDEEDIE